MDYTEFKKRIISKQEELSDLHATSTDENKQTIGLRALFYSSHLDMTISLIHDMTNFQCKTEFIIVESMKDYKRCLDKYRLGTTVKENDFLKLGYGDYYSDNHYVTVWVLFMAPNTILYEKSEK